MLGLEILGLPKMIDRFQVQGKSSYVVLHQNASASVDSLVVCKFANMAVPDEYFARALSAVTGLDFSTGDLIRVGERVWNLEQLYNIREGFTVADDTLPPRIRQETVSDGPSKGWVSHLPEMLGEYYRARGWDEQGVPTLKKLTELEIGELGGQQ